MILENWMLFGAALMGLVHVGAASFTFKAQTGNTYGVGPRDEDIRPAGMAGRMARAQSNFMETFPIFAALVLLAGLTGASGSASQWGSAIYLAARVVYLPLYASGIPWLRTISWNIATTGLVLVGVQVVIAAV